MEKLLHLVIERGSADYDLFKFPAEGVDKFFAYLGIYERVEKRHGKRPAHCPFRDHWQNLVLIDFLKDEGHAYDKIWPDVGQCLK